MKTIFDIYLIGLNHSENKPLIESLQTSFNIKEMTNINSESALLKNPLLIIFDSLISDEVLSLRNKKFKEQTPLISYIHSAVEPDNTKIQLLEKGVDDVILREMSLEEKVIRIKKIIQIYLQTDKKVIKISDIVLDKTVKILTYKGENLHLSTIEFDILYTLFENFKVEITREKLGKNIWEKQLSNNLNKHISNLKKKIAQTPIEIKSRRGKGITAQFKKED